MAETSRPVRERGRCCIAVPFEAASSLSSPSDTGASGDGCRGSGERNPDALARADLSVATHPRKEHHGHPRRAASRSRRRKPRPRVRRTRRRRARRCGGSRLRRCGNGSDRPRRRARLQNISSQNDLPGVGTRAADGLTREGLGRGRVDLASHRRHRNPDHDGRSAEDDEPRTPASPPRTTTTAASRTWMPMTPSPPSSRAWAAIRGVQQDRPGPARPRRGVIGARGRLRRRSLRARSLRQAQGPPAQEAEPCQKPENRPSTSTSTSRTGC